MNLSFKVFLCFGLSCFFAETLPAVPETGSEERFLVRDGVFCGEIFVADDCSMDELIAAQDLAQWIAKVGGTGEISVRLESFSDPETQSGIFVGKTRAAAREGIDPAPLGPEGFTICSKGKRLFLVGTGGMATRHAAAKLLNRDFGVEFVFPGDDGAEWSPKAQVAFPDDRSYARAWTWRSIAVRGEADSAWAAHLGFGERPQVSHNLYTIFTPELYKEHPELAPKSFGKVDAKRRGGFAPQANLANPLAADVALEAAKGFFGEHADATMFSVGINDCFSWDESEESAALYGDGAMRWFRNLPNRSDYFWGFAERVAQALAETEYADKKISAIAYLDCTDAPDFPLSKNVFPVVCADRSLWIFPDFAEEDRTLMQRWGQSGVEAWGIYDYYYGNPFFFPRLFFKAQADSLRCAYDNGARLFYAEIFPQVPFDAPKIWVLSRLLENPKADAESELKRFCGIAYGKAARHMYDFFKRCEKDWREQGGQCRWIKAWRNENSAHLFRVGPECIGLIDEARELFPRTPTDARERRIVARLEQTRLYLERAEKFAASFRACETLELASQDLDKPENLAAALDSPAWIFETIYNDVEWLEKYPDDGFSPCEMRRSDPRATAWLRLVEALSSKPQSPERLAAENRLKEILESLPSSDDAIALRKLVPAVRGIPIFKEDFEPRTVRRPEDGEIALQSRFVALDQDGWRAGKTIAAPESLRLLVGPAENLFCGEISDTLFGKRAMKIAGGCESAEVSRRFPVKAGQGIVASVRARGKISVGASAGFVLAWRDARGKYLGERKSVGLSCGETADWERFVVAGVAPEEAAYCEICFGGGLFGPDDYVCFDELEAFEF